MGKTLTNEEFLKKLEDKNIKYVPLEEYGGQYVKIKWQCCNNSSHIFEVAPRTILSNKGGCPYCSHRKVFVGETDMWTTNPELASMLKNPDDGYKHFATGSQKVDWICPCCGFEIKNKIINNVRMQGLSCPRCSDGMSFAEKFVYELFNQLCCDFIHDKTTDWPDGKRYDFYIPEMNLIVETNGAQHYNSSFARLSDKTRNARTLDEEIANDEYKKQLALSNGIEHYVVLDCSKSDLDYIKKSILDSELSMLFDLSNIDWCKCFKATITSNVMLCANLWNDGMKNTQDISDYTGIHISSVISNLKKAAKSGLCDFVINYKKIKNKNEKIDEVCRLWNSGVHDTIEIAKIANISKSYTTTLLKIGRDNKLCDYRDQRGHNRGKSLLCVETGCIYDSIASVTRDGYSPSCVSNCCNGKSETYMNKHWQFI